MTYKNASQGMQARARRFQIKEVGDVREDLTVQEKADNLRRKKDALIAEKGALDGQSKALGAEIQALQIQLNAMGVKQRLTPTFSSVMLDVIKREVTAVQWSIWFEKAKLLDVPEVAP